jgi:hypothetical protein
LARFFRRGGIGVEGLCRKYLGTTGRETKASLRGALRCGSVGLQNLKLLKALGWPLETSRSFLENMEVREEAVISALPFFKQYSPGRWKKLMDACANYNYRVYSKDAIRMGTELLEYNPTYRFPEKPGDFKELHDALMSDHRKMTHPDLPILTIPELHLLQQNGLLFRCASSTHEVIEWGTDQRHCIGMYANDAARGECTLVEIWDGDTRYHAMIRRKQMVQCYGKYNSMCPPEVRDRIYGVLFPLGILGRLERADPYEDQIFG